MAKFSGRLRNPPVVYALCQITFPTVGTLEEPRAEAVHAPLRSDYPYRIPQSTAEFTISPGGGPPTAVTHRSWLLHDRRKQSGYVLGSTTLVYRTAAYQDFEHFLAQTLRGVEHAVEVLKPAVIERVGLRYVDLIESTSGEPLERYLEPPLHGFQPRVEGFNARVSQQLIRGTTKQGELVFRFSRARHSTPLPADLMDASLANLRSPRADQESVFVDIDHFRENADLDPDPKALRQLILDLQDPMSTLFKDAVSEFAIKKWNTA